MMKVFLYYLCFDDKKNIVLFVCVSFVDNLKVMFVYVVERK